jgi:hypothetical protein
MAVGNANKGMGVGKGKGSSSAAAGGAALTVVLALASGAMAAAPPSPRSTTPLSPRPMEVDVGAVEDAKQLRAVAAPAPEAVLVTRSEASAVDGVGGGKPTANGTTAAPQWPMVECSVCLAVGHWRGMKAEKVWVRFQEKRDDPEDEFSWKRTCIACVALAEGVGIEQVKEKLFAAPIAHKKARAAQLAEAKERHREEFTVFAAGDGRRSKRELRELLKSTMDELFSPLAKYILRKQAVLEAKHRDVLRHNELTAQLAKCENWEDEKAVLAELESLEIDDGYLAFQGPSQHEHIFAASYSDMWTQIFNKDGALVGGISSWYVCLAMTGYGQAPLWAPQACLRVTPSKDWKRKHDDPLATKQAWYCQCQSRYKASWGQLVQIARINRQTDQLEYSYVKADVPSWDVEDVRAQYLEETMTVSSAADLYKQIRRVEPTLTSIVVRDHENCTKVVDPATWERIPTFRWCEVFNLVGLDASAVTKGKKK